MDIGPLIKKGTITETKGIQKEKTQQEFVWALGPEATHQMTHS